MSASAALPHYRLKLFVAGNSTLSRRAIANLRVFCDLHLQGRVEWEVVDIYQQPELAEGHQIVAAPTLVKTSPTPERRVIGDLSQSGRLLRGLDLWVDGSWPTPG